MGGEVTAGEELRGVNSGGSGGLGGGATGSFCGGVGPDCFAITGGSRPNTPRSTSHRSTMFDLYRS